jgi:hypothetical protein
MRESCASSKQKETARGAALKSRSSRGSGGGTLAAAEQDEDPSAHPASAWTWFVMRPREVRGLGGAAFLSSARGWIRLEQKGIH